MIRSRSWLPVVVFWVAPTCDGTLQLACKEMIYEDGNVRRTRKGAFTLIELLVVVALILVLVSLVVGPLAGALRYAERASCQNNLKRMGEWFLSEAVKFGSGYPLGGTSPGKWGGAYAAMKDALECPEIGRCPAVKAGSPINPIGWATCSYAYVGHLTPTYASDDQAEGKQIWSLDWAGVERKSGYGRDAFPRFKNLPLADNIEFNDQSIDSEGDDEGDESEPENPTIPDHQDISPCHSFDVGKYRTERALREIPQSPEDHRGSLPLLMDILVFKTDSESDLCSSGDTSWKATDLGINTEQDKYDHLWANHCSTSAKSKNDWGINIFYTNGSVQWKDWDELRFQVMSSSEDGGPPYYCYFY